MNIASDISNLLGRFGANANGYLEVENTIEYKELPKIPVTAPAAPINAQDGMNETETAPAVAQEEAVLVPTPAAVAHPLHSEDACIEPVIAELPAVALAQADDTELPASATATESATVAVVSSSLRALLAEAALKRENQARSQHEEAAPPTLNIAQPTIPATVIAIASPKGGVGKTTLCAALASVLNSKGRVIAIDLDPQNVLQYHLGAGRDTGGPSGVALTEERWSSLLREGVVGTCVLSYRAISKEGPSLLEQRMQKDRHWLAKQLASMNLGADDVVILDTPSGRTPYLDQALDAADQVVVVVTPDAGSFMALDQIGELFEGHGDRVYVVNQFDASRTFCQDMLEVLKRRFGSELIGVVPLDHAISEGLAYGVNVLLEAGKSPARDDIRAIGETLQSQAEPRAWSEIGIRA